MGEVPLYLNQVEASPADPRVFIFIRHDMYVHAMELQRPAIALSNSWDDRSNPPPPTPFRMSKHTRTRKRQVSSAFS